MSNTVFVCPALSSRLCRALFALSFCLLTSLNLVVNAQQSSAHAKKKSDTLHSRTSEVTVSAARANSLDAQPITYNELSASQLKEKQHVYDVPALLADLPSTLFYSDNANGIGYSYLTMRGFDQRRIAVLINGIPQNDPEDHNVYWIDFPDLSSSLDNIQVQRGAGLVSYGAPAIGGSINLSTVNIARSRFAKISLGAGLQEHGAAGINAAPSEFSSIAATRKAVELCTGLDAHNTSFYARISEIQSRGYRDNSWSSLQSFFVSAASFQEDYSVQINVFGGPISDGLAYTGMPKSFITDPALRRSNDNYWEYDSTGAVGYRASRRPQEREGFSQPHFELLNSVTLSPTVEVSSRLFYYTGRGYFDYDASWADAATLRLTAAYGGSDSISSPGNTLIRAWVANKQIGWIPQVRWRHGGGELVGGVELRSHNSEHWANIAYAENLPSGFDPDFRVYSYEGHRAITSLFAREILDLGSSLKLSLEAQFTQSSYALSNEKAGLVYTSYTTIDGRTLTNGAELFSVNYNFFNPRIGLTWNPGTQHSAYVCIAQTKREPRMANLYAAEETFYSASGPLFGGDTLNGVQRYNFSQPLIKPESMIDVELGWKFSSSTIQAAATVYWMDFHDELVRNGGRDIFGNPIVGNAAHTNHMGLEVQADAELWSAQESSIHLIANATYSRNRFVDYSYVLGKNSIDMSGKPIAAFPDFIANLHAVLRLRSLLLDLGLRSIGSMYSDNFGSSLSTIRKDYPGSIDYTDNVVEAALVLNANISYELRDVLSLSALRLRASVNNIGNTLYAAAANGKEFFPAAERHWFFTLEVEP